jgi:N6-adenosine-specific RNA methylase IME4
MSYRIIYADPAWSFDTRSNKGKDRSPEKHYPVMAIEDICALPVADIAADDCALFLWVNGPCLFEAQRVINAWGFEYKSIAFVWAKQNKSGTGWPIGCGYWTRQNPELCLLGTRGSPKRIDRGVRTLVIAPRGQHSAKPPEVRERIVKLLGDLPRAELFAREQAAGWDTWGNQVESSINLPGYRPHYLEAER